MKIFWFYKDSKENDRKHDFEEINTGKLNFKWEEPYYPYLPYFTFQLLNYKHAIYMKHIWRGYLKKN